MKIIFGADINKFDANTRQIAQENVKKVKLANGKFINVDRNRVVRGLHIPKSEVNLKSKNVNNYQITFDGNNTYICSCKDFKNVGDILVRNHIIDYLAKSDVN